MWLRNHNNNYSIRNTLEVTRCKNRGIAIIVPLQFRITTSCSNCEPSKPRFHDRRVLSNRHRKQEQEKRIYIYTSIRICIARRRLHARWFFQNKNRSETVRPGFPLVNYAPHYISARGSAQDKRWKRPHARRRVKATDLYKGAIGKGEREPHTYIAPRLFLVYIPAPIGKRALHSDIYIGAARCVYMQKEELGKRRKFGAIFAMLVSFSPKQSVMRARIAPGVAGILRNFRRTKSLARR